MRKDIALAQLANRAKMVLANNDLGSSTKPSPHLYPHQWNWDSAFIAMGLSHENQSRAEQELKSLVQAQWSNGMIPHIVFNPEAENYHPGPEYWTTNLRMSPTHVKTSGITQPPVVAQAALDIYHHARHKKKALTFLKEIYPALIREQRFLSGDRDPQNEGLAFICHPWESGMDNSPIWDKPLNNFEMEFKADFMRKDNTSIPTDQRPTDDEYARYSYLVQRYGQENWDQTRISELGLFKVQSILFNVLYLKYMQDLSEISKLLGHDSAPIDSAIQQTVNRFESKLWDENHSRYLDYDMCTHSPIQTDNISQFLPLFAGIPSHKRADRMISKLQSTAFWPTPGWGICTQSRDSSSFDYECYWRGPVWINMNWMIIKGLERYNRPDLARLLAHDTLDMVNQYGFYEYFNPDTGKGLGSDNFSWTAALVLDLTALGYR